MPELSVIKKLLKKEDNTKKATLDDIKYFNDLTNNEIDKLIEKNGRPVQFT